MTDTDFLQQAIALALAKSADGRHGPFGAVIVRAGKVVGRGWNRVVAGHDPTAHSEVVAIRAAGRKLRTHALAGCTIYCSCEPCPMCLAAILWARLDRIVFACTKEDAARAGFDDAHILGELRLDWPRRRLPWAQRGRDAGLLVFEKWLANANRTPY
jgi:guanine deaminase